MKRRTESQKLEQVVAAIEIFNKVIEYWLDHILDVLDVLQEAVGRGEGLDEWEVEVGYLEKKIDDMEAVFGALALAIRGSVPVTRVRSYSRRCALFAEEATQATHDDLSKLNVQELRQLAKKLGMKGYSTMKKTDLIAELEEVIEEEVR